MTYIIAPDLTGLKHAADALQQKRLVAFPTETVYGLGGDATCERACADIFQLKQRPEFNPLITHIADFDAAAQLGEFNPIAAMLARQFWPGPLTLVVPRTADCAVASLACAGGETIALRVPDHPVAQKLLAAANMPIAAPSANRSGRLSPTRADHVRDALGTSDALALILDGGATQNGLESTIIGCFDQQTLMLRHGAIAQEEIEAILNQPLTLPVGDDNIKLSPGRLAAHYAPRAQLRLNVEAVAPDEALLAFGAHDLQAAHARNLSRSGDLREAAANFFAMLHELDARADKIAVMPIPDAGLGRAINDRLARAARNITSR